ncbi:MAG TPA: hypothetical protein VHE60_16840 [Pyrinomonadaceae bacterium]|nr:hypothetical protein [Pyrinomonadaceae bacterium]
MTRKLLASVVAALVLNLVCVTSASAKPAVDKEAQFAAKVKAAIFKLGTGPAARVELKLRDGTKLKGYVTEAGDDRFVVIDEKSGASRDVPYPQVKQAKGNNLSTGAKIAITVAIVVGLLFLLTVVIGRT